MEAVVGRYGLEEIADWITKHDFKTIALQFKQQRLRDSVEVVKALQRLTSFEHEFYVVLSPSCSVDYLGPLHLGNSVVDAIVCFGTTCLSKTQSALGKLPVFFAFESLPTDTKFLQRALAELNVQSQNLLVLYSLEYLKAVSELFKDANAPSCVAKLCNSASNWNFADSVREFIADDQTEHTFGHFAIANAITSYSGVVWIGTCNNLYFKVNAPTKLVEIDPATHDISETKSTRELMKRSSLIEKAKAAEKIGVVIGNSIPNVGDVFEKLSELSAKSNKVAYFISLVQFVDETKFGNFGELDLFVVVTACNCHQLVQQIRTNVPLVTLLEYEIALGLKRSYGNLVWNEDGPEVASLLPQGEADVPASSDVVEYKQAMKGSWFGLSVDAGQHEIKPAVEGMKGVASGYAEEPIKCSKS